MEAAFNGRSPLVKYFTRVDSRGEKEDPRLRLSKGAKNQGKIQRQRSLNEIVAKELKGSPMYMWWKETGDVSCEDPMAIATLMDLHMEEASPFHEIPYSDFMIYRRAYYWLIEQKRLQKTDQHGNPIVDEDNADECKQAALDLGYKVPSDFVLSYSRKYKFYDC